MFGINISYYDFTKDEVIRRMANCSVQYLWEASKIMSFNYLNYYLLNENYIKIVNNEAVKADAADENLKDYFTIYTQSEKQNKANEILINMCNEFCELEKLGVSPNKFFNAYGLYKVNDKWKINGNNFINNVQ
ncbi:MAG: hypothetical protein H6Q15_2279 [Bacteroidetes bacterium]|nr:hypothetical protein [Bacteroidota bacterium]